MFNFYELIILYRLTKSMGFLKFIEKIFVNYITFAIRKPQVHFLPDTIVDPTFPTYQYLQIIINIKRDILLDSPTGPASQADPIRLRKQQLQKKTTFNIYKHLYISNVVNYISDPVIP